MSLRFFFGMMVGVLIYHLMQSMPAQAFNVKGVTQLGNKVKQSITQLATIKKDLDQDIKNLKKDAHILMSDKDKLLAIKNQLIQLANQTKAQIDSIQTLVGEVEGHIKMTQKDIQSTAQHVSQVDVIRKKLGGK